MADERGKPSILARFLKATGAYTLARQVISTVDPTGSGFFSPGQPLQPLGPPQDKGRILDYPIGTNINIQPRANEAISFYDLRWLADSHDITRLLIETRKDQIESLDWSFVPVEDPQSVSGRKDIGKRVNKLNEFFQYPDGVTPFGTWIRAVLEDLLVIDAPTIYINREDPYATKFEVVAGDTIKRLIDTWGQTPLPPDPAYQQIIKGLPAFNYTTEEMLYMPRNVRPNRVYGFSPVEQITLTVNIALRKQYWQLQFFTEGNIPDMLIGTPPEWNPDQIADFQKAWDIMHEGNTAQRRKAKFVPGGSKPIQTKEIPLKDPFDEWLARIACYAFSIPPTPFIQQSTRSSAMMAQEVAEDEGLMPLRRWTKQLIDRLAQEYLGQKDIEFQWAAPIENDPQKHIAVIDLQVRDGLMTINEGRASLGRDPIPGGDVALIFAAAGPIPVEMAGELAKAKAMPPMIGGPPGAKPKATQENSEDNHSAQEKAPNRPPARKPQQQRSVH